MNDLGRLVATFRAQESTVELLELKREHARRLTAGCHRPTSPLSCHWETHEYLNLLINVINILSIPNVIQNRLFFHFAFTRL